MKDDKAHKKFIESVDFVNNYTEALPADLLLKLYAYYRIAHKNFDNPSSKTPLINAFKANALIQAKNLSPAEAMQCYTDLVNKEIRKN
ncbi:acyl-CoA-binding protein [Cellulophaga sp. F20128]|uniref:acyl-CoA-binding protein n=1 Tax=Cellulophaga sp. F20128 TaxID=2926413 RepID=UPI001FF0E09A|nr:acyl-CoA-binding protein [Cellulophaga sp. F20128]MCK0158442.1 acyl-CoA-binding protein [Cellulophaga sp. F20128]